MWEPEKINHYPAASAAEESWAQKNIGSREEIQEMGKNRDLIKSQMTESRERGITRNEGWGLYMNSRRESREIRIEWKGAN